MSTHTVPVIQIDRVVPHPNADALEIIPVKGWHCVVRKGQFEVGDRAIYVEPDMSVPVSNPLFAFLGDPKRPDQTHVRIRGKRLRGVMSFGLLVPVPVDHTGDYIFAVGSDAMRYTGVIRWQPPEVPSFGRNAFSRSRSELPALPGFTTKFDLENFNNYPDVIDFTKEPVIVTEKVHGANARFCFYGGIFFVGSRTQWLRRPTQQEADHGHKLDAWHRVSDNIPAIEAWCRRHPGTILFGELYGNVQDLKYGLPDKTSFVGFAAYNSLRGEWCDTEDLISSLQVHDVPHVPVLWNGFLNRAETLKLFTESDSAIPTAPVGHMREGIVVTPCVERTDPVIGRVSLKLVSDRYWER